MRREGEPCFMCESAGPCRHDPDVAERLDHRIARGSAKRGMFEIAVDLTLRGKLAETLVQQASFRHKRPVDLLADIVETVLEQDLVTAVLDDK